MNSNEQVQDVSGTEPTDADATAEEGTPEQSQRQVAIPDASREDLEAFLASVADREANAGAEPAEVTEDPVEEVTEEAKPTAAEQDDGKKAESEVPLEEQLKAQQAKIEEQQKRLEQQELYIDKRGTEIGQLRKEKNDLLAQLKEGLDETFLESPSKALQAQKEIAKLEGEVDKLDAEEQAITKRHAGEKLVAQYVKPDDWNPDAIAEVLQADKYDAGQIAAFLQDPFTVSQPETIIQVVKRSQEFALLKQVVNAYSDMKAKLEKLEAKPKNVLNGVQKALSQPAQVTAKTGGTNGSNADPDMPMHKLSREELERFLQK